MNDPLRPYMAAVGLQRLGADQAGAANVLQMQIFYPGNIDGSILPG
jgi:hypothetical protein